MRIVAFVVRSLCRLLLLAGGCLAIISCGSDSGRGDGPLKVSYIGLTCEGPIFSAYENGFFKEEGLEVELVKSDWDAMRDGLGLGRIDGTHHLLMFLLKPIEQGLDIRLTGGVHTGCLRLQAGVQTDIQKIEDFKGKKIGISNMGNPPFLFASRAFSLHDIDAIKEITWLVFPNDAMELALEQGQIDGVASAEPIGSILLAHNKVRNIVDQAVDPPHCNEYCCATVVSGQLANSDPVKAAKLTRALLKGAKYVSINQQAVAKMAVEKGYISASVELNAQAISKLNYEPGVTRARKDILAAARDMGKCGFLNPYTDPNELVERAWLDLDGVTDEWIKTIKVEKVADGGRPRMLGPVGFAAFFNDPKNCREFRFCGCEW